jgi:Putative amidoligase enzyme
MPALTREEYDALAPPAGWRWARRPVFNEEEGFWEPGNIFLSPIPTTIREAGESAAVFNEWMVENSILTEVISFIQVEGFDTRQSYYVYLNEYPRTPEPTICPTCEEENRAGLYYCEHCDAPMFCQPCRTPPGSHRAVVRVGDTVRCQRCTRACTNILDNGVGPAYCGNVFHDPTRNFRYCEECGTRHACAQNRCNVQYEVVADQPHTGYCELHAQGVCAECGTYAYGATRFCEDEGTYLCTPCYRRYNEITRNEQFDEEEIEPARMKLTSDPLRPVRICSIEMETADGGRGLARALYDAGLTRWDTVQPYHFGQRHNDFCHVEHDSSLGEDGGELIFNRVRMDNDEDIQKMHDVMRVVRGQIKAEELTMDMRCGLHIHVDGHQFGVGHVRNLVLVFNYLEDVLYRLAAARYARHRGMNYAMKVAKGPYKDAATFGVNFFNNNGHTSALNVSGYWAAMRERCMCGAALVGRHETCGCALGKCTFEFRIYNGTANFRKVQAYAAISQSLVGFARAMPDLEADDFPALEYLTGRTLAENAEAWTERLRWMLTNLYFSENERESVMYVIRNSQMAELGDDVLAELEATRYVAPVLGVPHEAPMMAQRPAAGDVTPNEADRLAEARINLNALWGRIDNAVPPGGVFYGPQPAPVWDINFNDDPDF